MNNNNNDKNRSLSHSQLEPPGAGCQDLTSTLKKSHVSVTRPHRHAAASLLIMGHQVKGRLIRHFAADYFHIAVCKEEKKMLYGAAKGILAAGPRVATGAKSKRGLVFQFL